MMMMIIIIVIIIIIIIIIGTCSVSSAILWCTQTHCALQYSPIFSKLSEKNRR